MRVLLLLILAIFVAVPSALARPVFIVMDVESRENKPEQFGYKVVARREKEETLFTLDLDSRASAAFKSAEIFFHTPVRNKPDIPIKVLVKSGSIKQVSFAVPTEHLAHCILQIHSGFLRPQDRDIINNFYAYRLRIDNIYHEAPQ